MHSTISFALPSEFGDLRIFPCKIELLVNQVYKEIANILSIVSFSTYCGYRSPKHTVQCKHVYWHGFLSGCISLLLSYLYLKPLFFLISTIFLRYTTHRHKSWPWEYACRKYCLAVYLAVYCFPTNLNPVLVRCSSNDESFKVVAALWVGITCIYDYRLYFFFFLPAGFMTPGINNHILLIII